MIFKTYRKCPICSPFGNSVLLIVLQVGLPDRFTYKKPNHVAHWMIPMPRKIDQPFLAGPEGLLEKLLE